jgi:hypothetical protein
LVFVRGRDPSWDVDSLQRIPFELMRRELLRHCRA